MAYSAKILLDSINESDDRLTTMEITYPRIAHADALRHRVFSRNSSGSRATPIKKTIEMVMTDPVIPVYWGKNQAGMQAREELVGYGKELAISEWLLARDNAVKSAEILISQNVHKQIVNRILEPWAWITEIISATEWQNFFLLRCHPDAQPELQHIAFMMRDIYNESFPVYHENGNWHIPMIRDDDEDSLDNIIKIATGRIARVSYLTHNGIRDTAEDIRLHNDLLSKSDVKHLSPFEHIAQASPYKGSGNFTGWRQYRNYIEEGESL